jgi:TolB-like protein
MSLFGELKRRNVFRVAIAYLAASWLLIEVAETVFPLFGFGDTPARLAVILLAIGFPLFLVFSWLYEFTPEGLMLEKDLDRTGPAPRAGTTRLDRVIIVLLVLALGYFAVDKFVIEPRRVAEIVEETAQQARSAALVESYGEKSIAVLPFVNLSADPEQEYFSDGISEEILNLLAQIPELRVISRSSAFSFKGRDIAIPEVAKQLNVAHVLEGSVRKAGERVRITAQLIEARSDMHLWSQTYDRTLDDIFAVQDEIAAAIGNALKMELALVGGEPARPTAIEAGSTAAYDAYLQARALMHHRNRDSMEEAVSQLERVVRLDDGFAPAHAQLAIATMLLSSYVKTDREAARRTALRHLDRAEVLEPDLAELHAGRALLAQFNNEPGATIEHAEKALASNPNYIDALQWLRIALLRFGRYEKAHAILEKMLMIDPLSIVARRGLGKWLIDQGRYEEAHEVADKLLERSTRTGYEMHASADFWQGKYAESLSWALQSSPIAGYAWNVLAQVVLSDAAEVRYHAGRLDEALPLYERAFATAPTDRPVLNFGPYFTVQMAVARRHAGDEEGARLAAELARQDHAARSARAAISPVLSCTEAMIAAFEGDRERALSELETAIQRGLRWPMFFDDPVFEALRDDVRFIRLRRTVEALVAEEHEKVLQLICFNNPAPENWQPMPATCADLEKQAAG